MAQTALPLPADGAIAGVVFKPLRSFPDNRGFFREIFRSSEPIFAKGRFAQWSHSKMQKNVVKAWHYHHIQTDWWYVPVGKVQTVLFDNRPESSTYRVKLTAILGEPDKYPEASAACVRIPPGVLHACKVLSEEAHLFYITSETYSSNEEGRFPYNSDLVGHDWGSDAIVAENDCRTFVPTSVRRPIAQA